MGLNAIVCVKYYSYSLTVEVEGSLSSPRRGYSLPLELAPTLPFQTPPPLQADDHSGRCRVVPQVDQWVSGQQAGQEESEVFQEETGVW